jgi:predicted DNA-binding transcriptional regulator YafY
VGGDREESIGGSDIAGAASGKFRPELSLNGCNVSGLMGRLGASETPVGVLLAFFRRRQWRQAELARELGVSVETVTRTLRSLSAGGMPLLRDDSDKPQVWWRVPKDWAPRGVLFAGPDTPALLRTLARAPRSRERDALLAHASKSARVLDQSSRVEAPRLTETEESWLSVVEDAARGTTLGMRYTSTQRGAAEWRYVSVQNVEVGPPSRFLAVCHRSGTMKRFRVEGIALARLDSAIPYRQVPQNAVAALLRESVDGYLGEGLQVACAFFVRDPEARWVARNLLSGMQIDADEDVAGGIRVRCTTPAVVRVARFVVGLGSAARVETPELALRVRELARGALEAGGERLQEGRAKRLKAPAAGG